MDAFASSGWKVVFVDGQNLILDESCAPLPYVPTQSTDNRDTTLVKQNFEQDATGPYRWAPYAKSGPFPQRKMTTDPVYHINPRGQMMEQMPGPFLTQPQSSGNSMVSSFNGQQQLPTPSRIINPTSLHSSPQLQPQPVGSNTTVATFSGTAFGPGASYATSGVFPPQQAFVPTQAMAAPVQPFTPTSCLVCGKAYCQHPALPSENAPVGPNGMPSHYSQQSFEDWLFDESTLFQHVPHINPFAHAYQTQNLFTYSYGLRGGPPIAAPVWQHCDGLMPSAGLENLSLNNAEEEDPAGASVAATPEVDEDVEMTVDSPEEQQADEQSGYEQSGDEQSGDEQSGDEQSGDEQESEEEDEQDEQPDEQPAQQRKKLPDGRVRSPSPESDSSEFDSSEFDSSDFESVDSDIFESDHECETCLRDCLCVGSNTVSNGGSSSGSSSDNVEESRSSTPETVEPSGPPPVLPPPPGEDRQTKDGFILECRRRKISYRAMKKHGGLKDAVSTLRGRFRTLTIPRASRLRKPKWLPNDITLLRTIVVDLIWKRKRGRKPQLSWTAVSVAMAEAGASYTFGAVACSNKWSEIGGGI